MSGPGSEVFPSTYAQARSRFLAAALDAGLRSEAYVHPQKGIEGEELAIDVALVGDPSAENLLILSSGCHGVEGFCGSGIQLAALQDRHWREYGAGKGVTVLHVHALNPHGFSHLRRVTNENVDLNRNFHDFSGALPVNEAYRELHRLLLPDEWPPSESNKAAIGEYISRKGEAAFKAAVSGGQHEFPSGLFFGGTQPTWSNLTLRRVLRSHGQRAARIGWIDIHTGLGPSGVGERIYAGRDEAASISRARAWWAGNGATPLTSIYDGSSTSAFLTGMMWSSIHDECPRAEYTGLALEYGTLPSAEVIEALRADHWLHLHPDAPAVLAQRIRQQMKEAFFTDTDEWKTQVLRQAREAFFQAVDGLAA